MKRMTRSTFFKDETTKKNLELQTQMCEAINIIKNNKSQIATQALELIERHEVSFKLFYDIEKEDFEEIAQDMSKLHHITLPSQFPPAEKTIKQIESKLIGTLMGKTIYLRTNIDPYLLARTIVHELNHYLNLEMHEEEKKYKHEKVVEYCNEVRAFLAEKSFLLNGAPLEQADIERVHRYVQNLYPEHLVPNETTTQLGYLFSSYEMTDPKIINIFGK